MGLGKVTDMVQRSSLSVRREKGRETHDHFDQLTKGEAHTRSFISHVRQKMRSMIGIQKVEFAIKVRAVKYKIDQKPILLKSGLTKNMSHLPSLP